MKLNRLEPRIIYYEAYNGAQIHGAARLLLRQGHQYELSSLLHLLHSRILVDRRTYKLLYGSLSTILPFISSGFALVHATT